MVQNLLVTRFSNILFSAVWSNQYIDNVQIIFKETLGVDGRGGYFDNYGIIRDVMQNHLLQIVSLLCMDQPLSLHSNDIRDEKVRILKAIEPLKLENTVIGQVVFCTSMVIFSTSPMTVNLVIVKILLSLMIVLLPPLQLPFCRYKKRP